MELRIQEKSIHPKHETHRNFGWKILSSQSSYQKNVWKSHFWNLMNQKIEIDRICNCTWLELERVAWWYWCCDMDNSKTRIIEGSVVLKLSFLLVYFNIWKILMDIFNNLPLIIKFTLRTILLCECHIYCSNITVEVIQYINFIK